VRFLLGCEPERGPDPARVASSSRYQMLRYGLPVARIIPISQVRLEE
jgi:hypothetical protein